MSVYLFSFYLLPGFLCCSFGVLDDIFLIESSDFPLIPRLQNSRFFFSKSVKKSVKRGVRVLRARSARASHARRACEAREIT